MFAITFYLYFSRCLSFQVQHPVLIDKLGIHDESIGEQAVVRLIDVVRQVTILLHPPTQYQHASRSYISISTCIVIISHYQQLAGPVCWQTEITSVEFDATNRGKLVNGFRYKLVEAFILPKVSAIFFYHV